MKIVSKKKLLLLTLLVILVGMTFVKAASSLIEVSSITVKDKSATIDVVDPVLENGEIVSKITFNKHEDFVVFDVKLKNNASKRYKITNITDNNTNENIEVSYEYDKGYIENGSTSLLNIRMEYKNKLLNEDKRINNLVVTIELEDEKGEKVIVNPITQDNILKYVILLLISLVGIFLITKGRKGIKVGILIMVLSIGMIPFMTYAKEVVTLTFKDIVIKGETEIFTVHMDPKNGNTVTTKEIAYEDKLGEFPEVGKRGYTFINWQDEEGNEVTEDTIVTRNMNIEAVYTANTYTIKYDANGGSGTMADQEMTYDVKAQLSTNSYTNEDRKFEEWNTEADGSGIAYQNEEEVENLVESGEITLYAQWEVYASLSAGSTVGEKMKKLANNSPTMAYYSPDNTIKAIKRASSLPSGFTPSSDNTISTVRSDLPVYIFFDDTDGTMYYYSEASKIYLNSSISAMFDNMCVLEDISGLSELDSSKVVTMYYLFERCDNLSNVDALSSWDTSNVTSMQQMFNNCTNLSNIDGLSNWDTSKVTDISGMFIHCTSLSDIDGLSNWDTSSVTVMNNMFVYCTSLSDIDALSNWDTSSVTTMSQMFCFSSNLTNIDGASNWDTSNVTTMYYMFTNCTSLSDIDGARNWNTSKVTNMSIMFYECNALTNIDALSNWDMSSVTAVDLMFSYCRNLTNIDGASNWDTSSITNMDSMFGRCSNLTNIDGASNWDTSKVTNMRCMFIECRNLSSIDGASNWDTSNVTNMEAMFESCPKATGTFQILGNPTTYRIAFNWAAVDSGTLITVNYSSATTNIDAIIATKDYNSHVVKGVQVD